MPGPTLGASCDAVLPVTWQFFKLAGPTNFTDKIYLKIKYLLKYLLSASHSG